MDELIFEFTEDKIFFTELLCKLEETIERYHLLFDFKVPEQKRKEFNFLRPLLLEKLIAKYGLVCQLAFQGKCDAKSGFSVDHLIPLSTNKLNKELRKLKAEPNRKVGAQSFGSNNLANLIIACNKCNSFKKHKLLGQEEIRRILGRSMNS